MTDLTMKIVDLNPSTDDVRVSIPGTEGGDDVAWEPGDGRVAVACYDGTLRIFSAATGDLGRTLAGHAGPVEAVHWHPSGTRLASGGRDRTVKLWDPRTGALMGSLRTEGPVTDVLWIDEGRVLASLDRDGRVLLWDASRSLRQLNRR